MSARAAGAPIVAAGRTALADLKEVYFELYYIDRAMTASRGAINSAARTGTCTPPATTARRSRKDAEGIVSHAQRFLEWVNTVARSG